jgi:hypothetical protein
MDATQPLFDGSITRSWNERIDDSFSRTRIARQPRLAAGSVGAGPAIRLGSTGPF